jgi:hypothetical protein
MRTQVLNHDHKGNKLDKAAALPVPGCLVRIKGAVAEIDGPRHRLEAGGVLGEQLPHPPTASLQLPLWAHAVIVGEELGSWREAIGADLDGEFLCFGDFVATAAATRFGRYSRPSFVLL